MESASRYSPDCQHLPDLTVDSETAHGRVGPRYPPDVLDAGALIAIERGDQDMAGRLRLARQRGQDVVTHGGVVGQVWRGGARQARLARALRGIEVVPLDEAMGRRAGSLLAAADGTDVIDAAVVLLASDHDEITTSDPEDLLPLVVLTGAHVELRVV